MPIMRRLTIVLATLLLALMLYVVNMGVWVNRNIVDTETFVETTVSSLQTESSRIAVAEIIVEELATDRPIVLLLEQALVDLFAAILGTQEFEVVLVNVGELLHARIIDGGDEAIESDLTSIEEQVRAPLRLIAPELDALIPSDFFDSVAIIDAEKLPDASPYVAIANLTTAAAAVVALALGFLIVSLSVPRTFSIVMIGTAIAAAAFSTSWLVPGGRNLSIGIADDPDVEILIANLYDALAVSLKSQSRLLAAAGIAIIMVGIVVSEFGRRSEPAESAATESAID